MHLWYVKGIETPRMVNYLLINVNRVSSTTTSKIGLKEKMMASTYQYVCCRVDSKKQNAREKESLPLSILNYSLTILFFFFFERTLRFCVSKVKVRQFTQRAGSDVWKKKKISCPCLRSFLQEKIKRTRSVVWWGVRILLHALGAEALVGVAKVTVVKKPPKSKKLELMTEWGAWKASWDVCFVLVVGGAEFVCLAVFRLSAEKWINKGILLLYLSIIHHPSSNYILFSPLPL